MRTIGLIGGLSWQSTQTYYHIINKEINQRMGKNHSASILMYSFDFELIERLQNRSDWDTLNEMMLKAAVILGQAGADCLLICSNTMHECADHLERNLNIPLIHIADSVGEYLVRINTSRAGLVGTRFLMESATYSARLREKFNINTTMPDQKSIELINEIIYSELVKGKIRQESRNQVLKIIENMIHEGIEAIILGCTEIPLLIHQEHCSIPVIDTTSIHALSAVNFSLAR